MQLLAVGGLTLTAPAAWYVTTGALDGRAWWLWLLNVLCFAGGVFYVKSHVAAAIRLRPFESLAERAQDGAAVLVYHAGLVAVPLALASHGVISFWALLAYAPVVARGFRRCRDNWDLCCGSSGSAGPRWRILSRVRRVAHHDDALNETGAVDPTECTGPGVHVLLAK